MDVEKYQEIVKKCYKVKEEFLKDIDFEPIYKVIKENSYKISGKNEEIDTFLDNIINNNKIVEKLIDELEIYETDEMTLVLNVLSHFILEKLQLFAKDKIDTENYNENVCPFCNSTFKFAIIEEDGKKYLICAVCNLEWNYPRIKCPYCGNENQKNLSYYQFEDEYNFVRAYKCEKCNKLHKVFIKEKIKKFSSLDEANIETAHIDLFIQKEEENENSESS